MPNPKDNKSAILKTIAVSGKPEHLANRTKEQQAELHDIFSKFITGMDSALKKINTRNSAITPQESYKKTRDIKVLVKQVLTDHPDLESIIKQVPKLNFQEIGQVLGEKINGYLEQNKALSKNEIKEMLDAQINVRRRP